MRKMECAVCDKNWLAYSDAVMEHVRTSGKLHVAMLQYDQSSIEQLRSALLNAVQERQTARASYLEHIATHQTGSAGRGS